MMCVIENNGIGYDVVFISYIISTSTCGSITSNIHASLNHDAKLSIGIQYNRAVK